MGIFIGKQLSYSFVQGIWASFTNKGVSRTAAKILIESDWNLIWQTVEKWSI